jgi:acetate kinase
MTERGSLNELKAASSLAINSGSSSIKFALFTRHAVPQRMLAGTIERMGSPGAELTVTPKGGQHDIVRSNISDHKDAASAILRALDANLIGAPLMAIGHRIVHGGPRYGDPQLITHDLTDELKRLAVFVPNHLPAEIAMVEAMAQLLPGLPQVACFDTSFHHDLPDVARRLPIPRKYDAGGIRRYGFHGLSYAYLLEELSRIAGSDAARGRVILAHLGSGASLAAVHEGRCVDTTMGFTPTGGLVMGTRSGDLDPGLLAYLVREEGLTADQLETLINRQSGLLGMSEVSGDMRDLLANEVSDSRCAQAIAVFCYQARKAIGAFAAALGGLDTLVFSAGIGEHVPIIRKRICEGLGFLGVRINDERNDANAPVISEPGGVVVRVIPTDEELMIARALNRVAPGPEQC